MATYDSIRRQLEERLAVLDGRTARIEKDLHRPRDRDWEEEAIQAENDEVLEQLDASELSEMEQIRKALARIEDGSYGACERCGSAIDPRRLETLPLATLCVRCAG